MHTPTEISTDILEAFLRYYDSAYKLRNSDLMAERRKLLTEDGATLAEPYLEYLPSFPEAPATIDQFGLEHDLADWASFVQLGLMPFKHAYAHQLEALTSSLGGQDVVLTTGTGSGKTEALLLPIFARLARESRSWEAPGASPATRWWRSPKGTFSAQRSHERRPDAVRALVLYPMNALVEDQMVRLRKALDSPDVSSWLDEARQSNRFYFGRYTGRTPVPGTSGSGSSERLNLLREILSELDERRSGLLERVESGAVDSDHLYQLPNLLGSEMRSRWDMQLSPPDILITNYSMLSIALSREEESPLFDKTREWLEDSDQNVFTIAVDELHMYRGTAGTEVAYLLRRLVRRLGLDTRPNQLSILATSASLADDAAGRKFLSEFFDRPAENFRVVSSSPVPAAGAKDAYGALGVEDRLFRAFQHDGVLRPRPVSEVAALTFPGISPNDSVRELDSFIGALKAENPTSIRVRLHLFFRTLQGMWACSSPTCDQVESAFASQSRKIGKLYASPRFACACGARVLELLYCESCGEAMLGGYLSIARGRHYLVGSSNNFEAAPLSISSNRTHSNYRMYWPTDRTAAAQPWNRSASGEGDEKNSMSLGFAGVTFDHGTGELGSSSNRNPSTGLTFVVTPKVGDQRVSLPALPTRCPSCADDQERKIPGVGIDSPARSRSPIRTHGVGFDRALEVLVGALKRTTESKLVVFSDSRQGAAKVAANLEVSHYQDLVRLLIMRSIEKDSTEGPLLSSEGSARVLDTREIAELETDSPRAFTAYLKKIAGIQLAPGEAEILRTFGTMKGIDELGEIVKAGMLMVGMNPAGSHLQEVQTTRGGHSWATTVNWDDEDAPSVRVGLDSQEAALWETITEEVQRQVVRTVFAGGDRDLESLSIGYMAPRHEVNIEGLRDEDAREFVQSLIRILGKKRRVQQLENPATSWPAKARAYAKAVAANHGISSADELLNVGGRFIGASIETGYLISREMVGLAISDGGSWKCSSCEAIHMHQSAGVCSTCFRQFNPDDVQIVGSAPDYYAWLAGQKEGFNRLRVDELSGQTDIIDAQSRQARFQDVFLSEKERSKPHGIDVLSVTTTMEAGVDIGDLSAVVMANMPPQRFNYQQRVGRAGRRSQHLSVALTIARGGRSHDEHYFRNPGSITGDPPPQPFIDLTSVPIVRRSIAAELLSIAFFEVVGASPTFRRGRSVHGAFGSVGAWKEGSAERDMVKRTLANAELADRAVRAIAKSSREEDLMALTEWATSELAREIDAVASRSAPDKELSECLANAGVLPMFGFPTQVKSLFTSQPTSRTDVSTMGRDASLAISEFAPGRELVKDKAVHVVVGVVNFVQTKRGTYTEGANALGVVGRVGLCSDCLAMTQPDLDMCPVCGSIEKYATVTAAEPEAYRTSFRANSFEQLADDYSTSSPPRVFVPNLTARVISNINVRVSPNGEVVKVNDNNGDLFTFQQSRIAGRTLPGLIEDSFFTDRQKAHRAHTSSWVRSNGEGLPVALSSRRHTDIVLLETHETPGDLRLDPRSIETRGAWISAGYLIRAAASRTLDIGPDELEVGLYSSGSSESLTSGVFIADSLANGAGYAARVAEDIVVLLEAARQKGSVHGTRSTPCDSSCHHCLRDYRNWQWHPLLDWRLGMDIVDICVDGKIDFSRHRAYSAEIAHSLAKQMPLKIEEFDRYLVAQSDRNPPVAIVHPLADRSPESALIREIRGLYGAKLAFSTTFELVRRPEILYSKLQGGS